MEDTRAAPAMQVDQTDYRAIFDALGDAVLIHDAETGAILDVNQRMCEMFGYSPEEARQLQPAALWGCDSEAQQASARSLLAKAVAGSPQVFDGQVRDRAGRRFWVEVHLKSIRLGGCDRILAVLRDIDQRKQAEEALKESAARYRMITEGSLAGVYVIQDEGLAYVNPTFAQIFGYQPEGILGNAMEPKDLIHPEDLPLVKENLRRRLSGELDATYYTFRGLHRDGSVIHCESYGRAVEYQGRPAIVGTLLDITERRRAEEALQTHTRILESMAEGVTVTDADGKIIYSNPAFDAMFGYQPGELIGQHVSLLNDFPRSESTMFAREMVGQLQTKGILSGEVRNRKKDGTRFYTHARISALEISGKPCWILVQEDITERKQFEDALRESEASYRIVTEGSLAGVYLLQDELFRYVNPVLAQAFGYTPDEIIDRMEPLDLVHPEDRDRIAADMQRRLAGEVSETRNYFKGLRKDGSTIFCEVLTRQVEYQGRPAIMGTLLDVTERRLAEEALKASEEKYRTIFDAINDAIAVIDPETGAFLEVNQRFLESGYTREEVKQLSVADLCSADHPFTAQEGLDWMRRAVQEGPQTYEWWAEDRNGRRIWVEVNLTLATLGGQERLLTVTRDISERKQLEEVRRQAYEELERLVAVRTAGLELANIQLRREIEERRRNEAIIRLQRDLALTLSGEVGLAETLRLCVETGITFSGLDSGGVYLVDPGSGDLHLAYHQGFSPEFVQSVSHFEADSINAYLVMAGKPVYARLPDLPGILDAEGLKEGLSSAAIIPVIHKDQVIACINIASHTYEEVPETARAALETLAVQVGSAIARVQADEELRRAKEELEIRVAERTAQLKRANESLEEELRVRGEIEQSLRRQAELLDLAHDAIVVRDLANRILFWNSGAEETYGWSREDVQGKAIHSLLHTKFPQPLGELGPEFFRQGQWQGELTHTRRDGRRIVVASRWALQRDQEGNPTTILEINRDITERKQAEAGRARLAAILEATSDLVATADRQGRLLYLNRAGRQMLGIGADEDISHFNFRDLHPEWATRLILEQGRIAARRHEVWSGETAFLSRSGQEIPTSQVIVAHKGANGRVEFYSTIARDITESKRAAETLEEVNNRLRTLVQACPLAIIARNLEGKIISWNPAAEHMFGWRQDEVMGRPLPTIPPDQEEEYRVMDQRKLQGNTMLGLELRRRRRDGALIDVRLSTAPLLDGTGAMMGMMGIIEDVTERKRMEETLRKVSRSLQAITACRQALIRATNEAELLHEVCRIIVEVGGYRMAWVGFADHDAGKTVRPAAQTGLDEGYLEQLQLTWANQDRGRGPVGKAIRQGKPALCRNTQTDPDVAFIREEARKRGFSSILALPLNFAPASGALAIYAVEPDAFDHEEINLLIGLADDLAYGITALRAQAERRRAEEALKESEQELRLLTSRLLSIQEKERRRVARELHDELGQSLTVLKIHLVAIEEKLSSKQQHLKANCEQMLSYIDTVIENVRRLSWDLSPSSLEDLGLSSSLAYLVDEICRNNNIQNSVAMDEIDQLFSPETQINIYRIFQESLTNIVRHARADHVSVNVKSGNGKVSFMIQDNGRGFNVPRAMSRKFVKRSLGLTAMNERALMAQGSLKISSQKGQGTTITFTIPTDNHGK